MSFRFLPNLIELDVPPGSLLSSAAARPANLKIRFQRLSRRFTLGVIQDRSYAIFSSESLLDRSLDQAFQPLHSGNLKRGYVGTYHQMSTKHLSRYVNEFSGRHNQRPMNTSDQMTAIARGMDGKRLRYVDLIGPEETRLA